MPLPVSSSVRISLGYRERMASRPSYIHRGVDFACATGTKVYSTRAGKVVHAGWGGMGGAFGIHVVVFSGGIWHIYAHLSSADVKVGASVGEGQYLGRSGATGNVTGPHLHYGEFTRYHYLADRAPKFLSTSGVKPNTTTAGKPVKKKVRYTVTATLLNGRGGPGTDYKVLTQRTKGFTFTATRQKGDWVMASRVWYHTAYLKKVAASTPSKPAPAPKPVVEKPQIWYGVQLRNIGGFNTKGAQTIKKRIPKIVADIKKSPHYAYSAHAILELPKAQIAQMDTEMGKIGFKRVPKGSDGRHIYVPKAWKIKASGHFELKPLYRGDDKQAAWAILTVPTPDGKKSADAMLVAGHLEHEAPADMIRVDQFKSQHQQAVKMAKKHGLGETRIVHAVDTNSNTWVRDKAAEPLGLRDVFDIADKTTNKNLHTFVGWDGPSGRKGAGYDFIFVRSTRIILYAGKRKAGVKGVLDHLPVLMVMGWGVQ